MKKGPIRGLFRLVIPIATAATTPIVPSGIADTEVVSTHVDPDVVA